MAQAATQSMLAVPDENLIETVRKAKVQRTDSDEYEWVKKPLTESHSKQTAEDQSDKILLKMTRLFESVQSLGTKTDLSVKTLETQLKEGISKERLQRK